MKLKFEPGHVVSRLCVDEMRKLVEAGQLMEEIQLGGHALTVTIVLSDEPMSAQMMFDPQSSALHFAWPRDAVANELAKPTKAGIGGYFEGGVFSLAVDMHDVRDKARGKSA